MRSFLVSICLFVAQIDVSAVPVHVSSGPHPRAFLTPAEAVHVRARMDSHGWAGAFGTYLINMVDGEMSQPLEIPHAGGQWTHWYTCPIHGATLAAESPARHVCPVDGEVYSGWPYDDVYITMTHQKWIAHLDNLAVCHIIDAEGGYAERARQILLEYASFYPTLELHNTNGNTEWTPGARLFAQTLEEAVALCRISRAYDFVCAAPCFSVQDRALIENDLLRAMVETIQANDMGQSNIQAWHNAAVGSAGFVLGDSALVNWAVNGPSGFIFHMNESVTPSGMWYEEAISYHWYVLRAYTFLLEAAERAGMHLYGRPEVKKMFDAPMRHVFPDLTFPPINNSERISIVDQRKYYEPAYRRYGDPAYQPLLSKRGTIEAFIWGVDAVPTGPELDLGAFSSNEPSEGLAILRSPGSDTAVFVDYGPGTSAHVHPAKLGVILYAFGDDRFVDPGHIAYGNPLQDAWFAQTLAHNTVVVNQVSQTKAPGTLKAFGVHNEFALVRASINGAYPGVTLDRTVCLADNAVIDIVTCTSENAATFDLPLHVRGELGGLPASAPCGPIGGATPYTHLQNVRQFAVPLTSAVLNVGQGNRIEFTFLDVSECYIADGYGPKMSGTLPMLLRRQHGAGATFVAVYQMLQGSAAAMPVSASAAGSSVVVSLPGISLEAGNDTRVHLDDAKGASPASYIVNPYGSLVQLRSDATLPLVSVPRFD